MNPSRSRTLRRALLSSLVAVAALVVTLAMSFDPARASSVVTPAAGTTGWVVSGHRDGAAVRRLTALVRVEVNGEQHDLLALELARRVQLGVDYTETDWDRAHVAAIGGVGRILAESRATVDHDPGEIAATQAAIWHVADRFELDESDPLNAAIVPRYRELVRAATERPATPAPPGGLEIRLPDAASPAGTATTVVVDGDATGPWHLELSDPTTAAHPVTDSGDCDVRRRASTIEGLATLCVTGPALGAHEVDVTVRSTPVTVEGGRAFRRSGRATLIMAATTSAQSVATATVRWR